MSAKRTGDRRLSVHRTTVSDPVVKGRQAATRAQAPGFTGVTAVTAIAGIPDTLRTELLARFQDVVDNYRRGHWEAATLNSGKFCEVVFTILKGRADGRYPDRAEKPRDMVQACRALETADEVTMGGRALRIQVPRTIPPVYEIRNNRGTGHAGAEIDPNQMDAEYVLQSCKWMLADLVRAYHQLDPETASQVVRALTEREVPLIWEVGGVLRVLDADMRVRDRVLVLLYGSPDSVEEEDLRTWAEYKNTHRFREEILAALHAEALIHYDRQKSTAVISPLGQRFVEQRLLVDRVIVDS